MFVRSPRPLAVVALVLVGCSPPVRREIDIAAAVSAWRARSASAQALNRASGQGVDVTDGLTLHEGLLVADALSPELVAARRRAQAAGAGADAEGAWANPRLEADVRRAVESVPDPWKVEAAVVFTVPLSGERAASRETAQARAGAAQRALEATRWSLREAIQRRWVAWSAAHAEVLLRQAFSVATRPLFDAAERLAATGILRLEQASVLEIEALEQAQALREATWAAAASRRALLAAMGLSPDAPLELEPWFGPETTSSPGNGEDHPEVQRALADLAAAESALRHADHSRGATLDVGPVYERDGGQNHVGVAVGAPIPSLDTGRAARLRAEAERDEAAAAVDLTAQRLAAEAVEARAELASAQARLEALRTELRPALDRALTQVRTLAAEGEVDPLVVRHLLTRDLAAHLAEIDARADAGRARVRLHQLAGEDTP